MFKIPRNAPNVSKCIASLILNMQVEHEDKLVQTSQVVRIFIANIIKYSLDQNSDSEFNHIKNSVHLITTDVDLLPLSTKIYHDLSHDINFVNQLGKNEKTNALYVALSCIGASVSIWHEITKEEKLKDRFGTDHIHANGQNSRTWVLLTQF